MNFYETVCNICNNEGITLCNLLSQLKMSKSNIRNWKKGVIPKISVRKNIAKITNTSIKNLLTEDEREVLFELIISQSNSYDEHKNNGFKG